MDAFSIIVEKVEDNNLFIRIYSENSIKIKLRDISMWDVNNKIDKPIQQLSTFDLNSSYRVFSTGKMRQDISNYKTWRCIAVDYTNRKQYIVTIPLDRGGETEYRNIYYED